jgi:hypothetical protein
MRRRTGFVFVTLLAAAVCADADTIDNFSCPDSVSLTGASGFNDNVITCPGSIGGGREDFIYVGGGSDTSVSTMNSNPPTGAITGTFGSGITGYEGMYWANVPDLDLVGDSILVQLQSDLGGSLTLYLGPPFDDLYTTETFSGSPSYQNILIPLTDLKVLGTGGGVNQDDVKQIGFYIGLDSAGGTWTIDGMEAVPEPSTLLLTGAALLLVVITRFRRGKVLKAS